VARRSRCLLGSGVYGSFCMYVRGCISFGLSCEHTVIMTIPKPPALSSLYTIAVPISCTISNETMESKKLQ